MTCAPKGCAELEALEQGFCFQYQYLGGLKEAGVMHNCTKNEERCVHVLSTPCQNSLTKHLSSRGVSVYMSVWCLVLGVPGAFGGARDLQCHCRSLTEITIACRPHAPRAPPPAPASPSCMQSRFYDGNEDDDGRSTRCDFGKSDAKLKHTLKHVWIAEGIR